MKAIGKLKLNQLSNTELKKREMATLKGGANSCGCACYYKDLGGSSTADNDNANFTSHPQYCGGEGCNSIMTPEGILIVSPVENTHA